MDTTSYEKEPNTLMKHYCDRATLAGISPHRTRFPAALPEELSKRQKEAQRLCAYAQRLLRLVTAPLGGGFPTCLLLDGSGCVLASYQDGAPQVHSSAPGRSPGDIWALDQIGPNAVTVGLAEGRPMATVGQENYHIELQSAAIYYAPILAYSVTPPTQMLAQAGIALIAPQDQAHAHYLALACTIAHDLVLNLHSYQASTWSYNHFGEISLSAGASYKDDGMALAITHYDALLFELFHIPPSDLFLQPLDALIDPRPHNREFWTLLEERRHVVRQSLSLTVQGKDISCVVTICPLRQPSLGMDGFDFIITTTKQVASQVASKMGSRALRSFEDIIGHSPGFRRVIDKGLRLAATESNVMLTGESGVGKDVFAQAIHNGSARRTGPLVAINCAAIPRDLLASELFGYDGGAFTGARRQGSIGKFELADGGTIFLDEIGDLPLDLQASLLRVVEQKQFMRLGSTKWIDVDVKIISATNADMALMIRNKEFRPDLYYRLSTMQLEIPPLRQRGDDVVHLAKYFSAAISQRIGRPDVMTLSPAAKKLLQEMPWPGNVRELQNLIERIVQLYPDPVIEPHHILENTASWGAPAAGGQGHDGFPAEESAAVRDADREAAAPAHGLTKEELDLLKKREPLTLEEILHALKQCNGNRTKAASYLGVSRKTLYRYLDRLSQS